MERLRQSTVIAREDSAQSQGLIFVEEYCSRSSHYESDMSDNTDRVNNVALDNLDLELSCG